ncbi:hypothetical protein ACSBR2_025592 [Camellia fascicularis]
MRGHKQAMMFMGDKNGNNMLHLAGRVAPFDKLNLVLGAALQMQRSGEVCNTPLQTDSKQ